MAKYQKKPVVIEAIQISASDDNSTTEIPRWYIDGVVDGSLIDGALPGIYVKTLEGTMHGAVGDWLIKGVKGELYPCKPDIFEATYTKVE